MPEIIHLKILTHDELCQRRQMYFIFNKCMYNEVFIALFPIPVYEYILYIYDIDTHVCQVSILMEIPINKNIYSLEKEL